MENKQILRKLIFFSVPLILSGILQQLFNWFDAVIIGNFIGETALAGVGCTTSIYNLFVTIMVGFSSGLTVLAATNFGKSEHSKNAVLLRIFTIFIGGVFLLISILGVIFMPQLLQLMNTPDNLFDYAHHYISIILICMPFLSIYNIYSAVLRGIGNSKLPFIAIIISSILNAILDIIFVKGLSFGVKGAASATVISQILMTLFIIIYTHVKYKNLLSITDKHSGIFMEGLKYGIPLAIQSGITSIGNLYLQRFMNSFGAATVAAITTSYRIDTMLLLPIINFSTAISTLTAQNIGANQHENAKRVFKIGSVTMLVLSGFLTAIILTVSKPMLSIFGLSNESIAIGVSFFKRLGAFYVVFGLANSIKGYLEGNADLLFSSILGIAALVVRIIGSYAMVSFFNNMVIAWAEIVSWIFMLVVFFIRLKIKHRNK